MAEEHGRSKRTTNSGAANARTWPARAHVGEPVRALREVGIVADVPADEPTTEGVIAALERLDLTARRVGVQLYPGNPNKRLIEFLKNAGAEPDPVLPNVYASEADDARVLAVIGRDGCRPNRRNRLHKRSPGSALPRRCPRVRPTSGTTARLRTHHRCGCRIDCCRRARRAWGTSERQASRRHILHEATRTRARGRVNEGIGLRMGFEGKESCHVETTQGSDRRKGSVSYRI
jgi:hypothetical protein